MNYTESELLPPMITKEFYRLIRPIVQSPEYRAMKQYKHHIKGSVFDHSVKVAYLCYRHHKRFGTKAIGITEFVRGALLHDYYLYDWHESLAKYKSHLFTHPRRAFENAKKDFPDLTKKERDMILRHMFPLTVIPPKTKAGWLICFYDKAAALSDYFGKNKWKRRSAISMN